jgi:hypothetical protein
LFAEIAKETLFGAETTDGRTGKAFLPRLLDITAFYAEVTFCIEESICAIDISRRYFCPRAEALVEDYSRLIAYYNDYSASADWSAGLEELVALCRT